jgi:hypothetical protein
VGDTTFGVGVKKHFCSGFEGLQAVPLRPSDSGTLTTGRSYRKRKGKILIYGLCYEQRS